MDYQQMKLENPIEHCSMTIMNHILVDLKRIRHHQPFHQNITKFSNGCTASYNHHNVSTVVEQKCSDYSKQLILPNDDDLHAGIRYQRFGTTIAICRSCVAKKGCDHCDLMAELSMHCDHDYVPP